MIKFRITILLLIVSAGALAQVKPNSFMEEVNPNNANFEVYSQKGGVNRRATLFNLKRYFVPAVFGSINYVPAPYNNPDNRMQFVTDPNGDEWYIDASGNAILLNGGISQVTTSLRLSGAGTVGSPLDIAQQGATTGQVLKWNGTTWAPASDSIGITGVFSSGPVTGSGTNFFPLTLLSNSIGDTYIIQNSVDSTELQDGAISFADLAQNNAINGHIIKWNGTSWVAAPIEHVRGVGAANQVAFWADADSIQGDNRFRFNLADKKLYLEDDSLHAKSINAGFSSATDPWQLRLLGRTDIGPVHLHHNWGNTSFTQFSVNYGTAFVGFASPSTAITSGARLAFMKAQTNVSDVTTADTPMVNMPIAQINVFMHRGQTSSLVSSGTIYDYSNGGRWLENWIDSVAADGTVATRADFYTKNVGGGSIPSGNLVLRIDKLGNVRMPYYPSSRNDAGAPTNVLSTTADGTIVSHPVGELPTSGGIGDGDKGDITVTGSGTVWSLDAGVVGPTQLASTSVTPGSYTLTSLTVDADGRITSASSGSEVDGSVTNEGALTVGAGTGTTSIINSNTSGSTGVTLTAGTGLSISESGNTITITNSAPDQTVSVSSGAGVSVTGTYPNFTITNTGDTDASNDLTTATSFSGDVTGAYNNLQLSTGVVGNAEIAANAVDSTKVANGGLSLLDLQQDGAVTNDVITWNGSRWVTNPVSGAGITTLNTLTAATQTFATGTIGTDFNISSTSSTHTFNIPSASATSRGAVTTGLQTFGGVKAFRDNIIVGEPGYGTGQLSLNHTDGTATIIQPAASSNWTLTLPANDGNNAYPLITDGSGATSWSQLTKDGLAANSVDSTKVVNGSISLLDLQQDGAASGEVIKWNGSRWITDVDNTGSGGSVISPPNITVNQNDYNPTGWATANRVFLTSDAERYITGFASGSDGDQKTLVNIGAHPIILPGGDTLSSAANRLLTGNSNHAIQPGAMCEIIYSSTKGRWIVVSSEKQCVGCLSYRFAPGSVTAADHEEIVQLAIGSGNATGNASPTATVPYAALVASTSGSSTGGGAIGFPKTINAAGRYGQTRMRYTSMIHVLTLSDDTDAYTAGLEFQASASGATISPNGSIGVYYTHTLNSGNWTARVRDPSGVATEINLGVPMVTNTPYEITMELSKDGSVCHFYINGNPVGRLNTTMSLDSSFGARSVILKSAGTNIRNLRVHNSSLIVQ